MASDKPRDLKRKLSQEISDQLLTMARSLDLCGFPLSSNFKIHGSEPCTGPSYFWLFLAMC